MDYCYPDLLSNEILIANISRTPATTPGCLCVQEFASNLRNALLFVTPNDGRIFVAEQVGVVHIYYKNGTRLQDPFMDVSDLILIGGAESVGERGLLSLAFHPNFQQNGKLYIFLSLLENGQQNVRISEFQTLSEDGSRVDPNSERLLLKIPQPFPNHHDGQVCVTLILLEHTVQFDLLHLISSFVRRLCFW